VSCVGFSDSFTRIASTAKEMVAIPTILIYSRLSQAMMVAIGRRYTYDAAVKPPNEIFSPLSFAGAVRFHRRRHGARRRQIGTFCRRWQAIVGYGTGLTASSSQRPRSEDRGRTSRVDASRSRIRR